MILLSLLKNNMIYFYLFYLKFKFTFTFNYLFNKKP